MKCRVKFSDWGPVLGGIPQGSCSALGLLCKQYAIIMLYQFGGQQYIKILYPELIVYITEQSVLFVHCIGQNVFLDITKLFRHS